MSATPVFFASIKDAVASIANADGTSFKTLLTAGASGSRIKSLCVSSDDTADRIIQFSRNVGGVDYVLGEVTIPDGSGTNGVDKSVNVLNETDLPWLQSDGFNNFIDVANGSIIKVRSKTSVTAAKVIHVTAEYGEP